MYLRSKKLTPPSLKGNFSFVKIAFKKSQKKTKQKNFKNSDLSLKKKVYIFVKNCELCDVEEMTYLCLLSNFEITVSL